MNILKISWKNIWNKPLNALLSVLLITLGVTLISLTILLSKNINEKLTENIKGIDMVIGAKGSPLQIILSSLYHIDAPTGNVSFGEANEIANHFLVDKAIPLAFGDSFKGAKILGTDESFVDHYSLELEKGMLFSQELEVCLGSEVAQIYGLNLGSEFYSQHGMDGFGEDHTDHPFKVVGIFKRTGEVADQLIITPIESIWHVHEHHDHDGEDHHHDHEKEITSMLVTFKNHNGIRILPRMVNGKNTTQAALPSVEINRLFSLFGFGFQTLRIVAIALMIIAGVSIFISMLQALRSRKFELALLRSLGASKVMMFFILLTEAILLTVTGVIAGIIFSRVILSIISAATKAQYKYDLTSMGIQEEEYYLILATFVVALLASFLPALKAGNVNISEVFAEK